MHLRRALLLFAIVLGLAAVAASISRTPQQQARRAAPPATPAGEPRAAPEPGPRPPETVRFRGSGRPESRTIRVGRAASVVVSVRDPGQVVLEGLGLSAAAEPLTPARFDVLADRPGRHDVVLEPAGTTERRKLGVLVVRG